MFKGLIQPNESLSGDGKAGVVASEDTAGRQAFIEMRGSRRGRPALKPRAVVQVSLPRQGVIDIPSSHNS